MTGTQQAETEEQATKGLKRATQDITTVRGKHHISASNPIANSPSLSKFTLQP